MRVVLEPAVGLLLQGLLVGMSSSVFPVLIVFSVLLSAGYLAGNFGIVIAVVSTMSTATVSMSYSGLEPVFATSLKILQHTNRPQSELKLAKKLGRLGDRAANAVKGIYRSISLLSLYYLSTISRTRSRSNV